MCFSMLNGSALSTMLAGHEDAEDWGRGDFALPHKIWWATANSYPRYDITA